jgi:hypothetical protein
VIGARWNEFDLLDNEPFQPSACKRGSKNQMSGRKYSPKLATEDVAAELIALLCSAAREIGLKEHVCTPANRPELLKWMKAQCEARRVWTLADGSTLQGMLILKENGAGILYVVVAESFRVVGSESRLPVTFSPLI